MRASARGGWCPTASSVRTAVVLTRRSLFLMPASLSGSPATPEVLRDRFRVHPLKRGGLTSRRWQCSVREGDGSVSCRRAFGCARRHPAQTGWALTGSRAPARAALLWVELPVHPASPHPFVAASARCGRVSAHVVLTPTDPFSTGCHASTARGACALM